MFEQREHVGAWPMFGAPIALFATANWVRIPFEEAKMRRQFGAIYDNYVARVRRWDCQLLRCMSLLFAHSGHSFLHRTCPLSGVKRTWTIALQMSANDPKRTSQFLGGSHGR